MNKRGFRRSSALRSQHNAGEQWRSFAKLLRRLIRDGIRLRKRPDFTPERYQSRILRIDARLQELATWKDEHGTPLYSDGDSQRLSKAWLTSMPIQLFGSCRELRLPLLADSNHGHAYASGPGSFVSPFHSRFLGSGRLSR